MKEDSIGKRPRGDVNVSTRIEEIDLGNLQPTFSFLYQMLHKSISGTLCSSNWILPMSWDLQLNATMHRCINCLSCAELIRCARHLPQFQTKKSAFLRKMMVPSVALAMSTASAMFNPKNDTATHECVSAKIFVCWCHRLCIFPCFVSVS